MLPKPKRLKDLDILKQIRLQPCMICRTFPTEVHHLQSRGAGGPDEGWNLIAICRRHHTEIHSMGLTAFADRYSELRSWLTDHAWEINFSNNKWTRNPH